ncbi:MAG: glycosyltransferase [Candidatus Micrarchaeia archaeon]|jgi:glycosyltransferase involved in cell wall biosynthesis
MAKIRLLSAIVPCYNKGRHVYSALSSVHRELSKLKTPFEMVLVDDASPDNTLSELERFSKSYKDCTVVRHMQNQGKGRAVLTGFGKSKGDVIIFIDADLDLPASQIRTFLEYLEKYRADVVIGSKNHPDSLVEYPSLRRILSRFYQILCFVLFHMPVSDTQVGLKVFRRPVLQYAAPRMLVKKFAYDLELLVLANKAGFNIKEAPIELKFKGGGGGLGAKFFRSIFNMFLDTMAVWYRLKILHYYDKKR